MNLIDKKLEEIKPYEKNPRNNEDAVQYVANSIREFGFKVPIVIDKDGTIVAGHTRYKAAQELGLETVPCIIADDLTEQQIKAFRIADNKTADKATWDDEMLGDELKDILADFDMRDFGFGDFELTMLTEDMEPEPYDEELEEEYTEKAGGEDKLLAKKRVIIVYNQEQEDQVCRLFGLEELKKVVYELSEIPSANREEE